MATAHRASGTPTLQRSARAGRKRDGISWHSPLTPVVKGDIVLDLRAAGFTRRLEGHDPLFSSARFATFDHLLAVTIEAPYRDKCHGPLLASGCCQDEVQCGINLGPSPLLEHYPSLKGPQ